MGSTLATCLLVALALSFHALTVFAQNAIPSGLAIPKGNMLKVVYLGVGTQNYVCAPAADNPNQLKWTFVEPEARLYSKLDRFRVKPIGVHYLVPFADPSGGAVTFMRFDDQSFNINKRAAGVPSPQDPTKNIDWLKLQTTTTTSTGILGGITWVQRINTKGGVAPNNGVCDTLGKVVKVPYETDYL